MDNVPVHVNHGATAHAEAPVTTGRKSKRGKGRKKLVAISIAVIILAAAIVLAALMVYRSSVNSLIDTSKYQAVFLMMAVTDDMSPKTTVSTNIIIAIQNVAHSGLLRRSYHHCGRAPGLAASYTRCTSARRWPQVGYCASSRGGAEVSMPASRSLGPRLSSLRFRFPFLKLLGWNSKRIVASVSQRKPSGKSTLRAR